jgi:hypothetical protein
VKLRALVIGLALCAASCSDGDAARHAESVRTFADGDARGALDLVAELRTRAFAHSEAGARGTSEEVRRVLHDAALYAFATGEWRAAEDAAQRLATDSDDTWAARGALVVGAARHERARLSALQALGPEVEPFAFEAALAQVRSAQAAYVQVLVQSGELAEIAAAAAQNLERCERLVREIERLRSEAEQARARREADGDPNVEIVPEDDGAGGEGEITDSERADSAWSDLGPEELAALEALLGDKEREKLELRRARRTRESGGVERDW